MSIQSSWQKAGHSDNGILLFNRAVSPSAHFVKDYPVSLALNLVFAVAVSANTAPSLAQVGEIYFNSKAISSDNAVSCASCHAMAKAYQDGYERAIARTRVLSRNTPSILNVNRYTSFFWDGRASSLVEQVKGPLFTRHELNSSKALLTELTNTTPTLHAAWQQSGLPIEQFVQQSLADYMKSIATTSTRFNDYLNNNKTLSKQENTGWHLFSDKFKCTSCHALPNFTDNQFHDTGIPRRRLILQTRANPDQKDRYELGFDYGRANISDQATDLHAFRTPSLYNVLATAPYMHNGQYQTIEEVLDFYSRKRVKSGQTAITQKEMAALIAFMNTLTDARIENINQ